MVAFWRWFCSGGDFGGTAVVLMTLLSVASSSGGDWWSY